MYTDKIIICKDCGEEFVLTAGEQEFYEEMGFETHPRRCKRCRNRLKHNNRRKSAGILYEIVCSKCGKVDTIPFEPRHDRAVFCSECYKTMNDK